MRGRMLVMCIALVVSGCAQPADEGSGQDTSPEGEPEETSTATGTTGSGLPRLVETLRFDQANLAYENQAQRFLLTAKVPTDLRIDWKVQWTSVTWAPACMAGTVLHMAADVDPLFSAAAWSVPSHLGIEGRVAGRSVQTQTVPGEDQGSGPSMALQAEANVSLQAGESVLIAMGGTTPEAFHWDNPSGERSHSEMTVRVDGSVQVEEQGPRELACGVGPRSAENSTAGASFYLVEAEAGGSVGLTSHNASTAWILGQDQEGPAPVLHYLDDPPLEVVDEVRLAGPRSGEMRLEFPANAGTPFDHPAWLFVDDDWLLGG